MKRPGREADYSPPSSAEVKCVGLHLHSPICLPGVVVRKNTGTTFPLPLPSFCLIFRNSGIYSFKISKVVMTHFKVQNDVFVAYDRIPIPSYVHDEFSPKGS
jgi:hypothetical protein